MPYVPRREDQSAWYGLKHEITDVDCKLPYEDIPSFVLLVVEVRGWFSELRHGFDNGKAPVPREPSSGRLPRAASRGWQCTNPPTP